MSGLRIPSIHIDNRQPQIVTRGHLIMQSGMQSRQSFPLDQGKFGPSIVSIPTPQSGECEVDIDVESRSCHRARHVNAWSVDRSALSPHAHVPVTTTASWAHAYTTSIMIARQRLTTPGPLGAAHSKPTADLSKPTTIFVVSHSSIHTINTVFPTA
jgi:hypothetical protein